MPTYEYICKACEHEFEEFQSMSAKPLKKCPECAKSKLERLIGIGAGVIFKGGGFYETDYRSESYKKGADAEKKASEPKADKDSSGSCACGKKSKNDCASESTKTTPKVDAPKKKDGAASTMKRDGAKQRVRRSTSQGTRRRTSTQWQRPSLFSLSTECWLPSLVPSLESVKSSLSH